MGDGYLRIVKGRKNALLEVNHSYKQKDYVDWKYEQLKSICVSGPVARNGNGGRVAYRFNTKQNEELTKLYALFYKHGRKIIPPEIVLDPVMIAVWFMDDGSKCRERDVYLNTQQFSLVDQKKCVSLLKQVSVESSLNKDKEYWRVRIKKSSLPIFWNLISPHIIPAMNYKLGYNPVETYS